MKEGKEIYIQSKGKVNLKPGAPLYLRDLVEVFGDPATGEKLRQMELHADLQQDQGGYSVSIISIIEQIKHKFPEHLILAVGPPELLINFQQERKKGIFFWLRLIVVSFLLFIGSMTAIINFHSDVDMKEAHQTFYRVLTKGDSGSILWLQIPYSLGIGVGMSVFFNHVFEKRINQEPSPMEVEMYLYQENLDSYLKGEKPKIYLKVKEEGPQ